MDLNQTLALISIVSIIFGFIVLYIRSVFDAR